MRLPLKIITSVSLVSVAIVSLSLFSFIHPLLSFRSYLLGSDKPTTYTILLQNDTEIRANGGFAGSYAKITISTPSSLRGAVDGVATSRNSIPPSSPPTSSFQRRPALPAGRRESILKTPNINLSFQDIYVPNGQLTGHVDPPSPIQEAFQHGTWELANADWDPNFPTAAAAIRWFLEKGGETNPDLLVTLNLTTIKKILDIVGPFRVREYQAEITPQNLYSFLQSQAETNFFPGSTQKKDALTAVGSALKNKFFTLNPIQYFKIGQIILHDLNHGNLLVNSTNGSFQDFLESKAWAGRLLPGDFDTYMLVETNLGANKANCCINRSTEHTIYKEGDTYRHRVHLSLTNISSGHNPNPPFDFSGHYVSYLRFYLPESAWNIEVSPNQSSPSAVTYLPLPKVVISKNSDLTEIGFFHTTASGTTSTVDLSYYLATGSASTPYHLTLLKQNGLISSPQSITYQGKTVTTSLIKTTTIGF